MMDTPYQRIERCGEILLAARGSSIDTFNFKDGSLLATWRCPSAQEINTFVSKTTYSVNEKPSVGLETQKPALSAEAGLKSSPAKRRKLSVVDDTPEQTQNNGTKKEQKVGNKRNTRSNAFASSLENRVVIALVATEDARHVIAVTGEDKCIRVLKNDLDVNGKQFLKQVSQRIMPKRPCSIALTSDGSTIISADKFGDVYSLPLLASDVTDLELPGPATSALESTSAKPFVSAANTLTVHSQRNRKALENQKKQSNRPSYKTELNFEHKLQLGHVSMLTDLALVTLEGGRNFILSADRDEHIRVSRGAPQAHIIEGFCLGHTDFVSRLCVPKDRPEILISGGGDDELFVWEWARGNLLYKADLRSHVMGVMQVLGCITVGNGSTGPYRIAVSGIMHARYVGSDGVEEMVIVSCEGVPAMFIFLLTSQNQLQHSHTLKLSGNVLDFVAEAGGLVVSLDTIRKAGSTTEHRAAVEEGTVSLQKFVFNGRELIPSTTKFEVVEEIDGNKMAGNLSNQFYNLETLRKRDGDGGEED